VTAPKIVVINYGVGNLRSIRKGLEKSGAKVQITHITDDLRKSDAIVLPGVGAFAPAVKNMAPLTHEVNETIKNQKPILGICLGLQLLFTKSSEGGSIDGLNFISGNVIKIPDTVKTPQMGWNTINELKGDLFKDINDGAYVYFVHSYYVELANMVTAKTEYILPFCAAMQNDNFFAVQFHPEKSGKTGETILNNFIKL